MKNDKDCPVTGGGKGCWHEVLGLILLVVASILTIITANGLGIAAMYLVGLVLCCYKCFANHCMHHHHDHCHDNTECTILPEVKTTTTKKASPKTKAKAK